MSKIHWFAYTVALVVTSAFVLLNAKLLGVNRIALGWPKVFLIVSPGRNEFRSMELIIDCSLAIGVMIGTALTTDVWIRSATNPPITMTILLAVLSSFATLFGLFVGPVGMGYALQEAAITVVFVSIFVSWLGLFQMLQRKYSLRDRRGR